MKNVVAYCRVSTDGQVGEDKFGIEAQKEQIMEYCSRNAMQISAWYIDEVFELSHHILLEIFFHSETSSKKINMITLYHIII